MPMPSRFDIANAEPILIARIRALLKAEDHISFAELAQLKGFAGDRWLDLTDPQVTKTVLWGGISEDASAAVSELLSSGEIHFAPCSLVVYFVDGEFLKLPLAKRRRKYKTPLPCVIRRGSALKLSAKKHRTLRGGR